jgi:hypothetical protein
MLTNFLPQQNLHLEIAHPLPNLPLVRHSSLCPTAMESSTKSSILVRQVQNMLRQTRTLNDTPNLNCALFLNELANRIQQRWRELSKVRSPSL